MIKVNGRRMSVTDWLWIIGSILGALALSFVLVTLFPKRPPIMATVKARWSSVEFSYDYRGYWDSKMDGELPSDGTQYQIIGRDPGGSVVALLNPVNKQTMWTSFWNLDVPGYSTPTGIPLYPGMMPLPTETPRPPWMTPPPTLDPRCDSVPGNCLHETLTPEPSATAQ